MRKSLPILLLVVCVALFVAGIVWLFNLRYEAGDVYPPYSSLRADPLGTMALYESLQKLDSVSVQRDFTTQNRLPSEPDTTYLHLAGSPYRWDWMSKEFAGEIERFLTQGGRLVICFRPLHTKPSIASHEWESDKDDDEKPADADKKKTPHPKAKPKKKQETKTEPEPAKNPGTDTNSLSLRKNWGIDFTFESLTHGFYDVYEPAIVENQTSLPLPDELQWHSAIVLTNLSPAWRTIYARGTNAVVVERQVGRGSLVIATDSYFLSNEAMWKDRHTDLLSWLIGGNRNIVFDESHFGIVETTGIAGLMRKYRLHGLVGGLLLLAVLFIWKNSTSLLPPHADERQRGVLAGKDAAGGFVNLLRRNISDGDVLNTCFAEWKKACPQPGANAAARMEQARSILEIENNRPRRERNPIEAYRKICSALNTRAHDQNPRTDL
ncbi:MAG TPA: DUF4350 domain-containing protein [Verrucomicrobiota bacterium]|nr:DUF4350 domain-containing protein [Verrucomicrobiota bacterium]